MIKKRVGKIVLVSTVHLGKSDREGTKKFKPSKN